MIAHDWSTLLRKSDVNSALLPLHLESPSIYTRNRDIPTPTTFPMRLLWNNFHHPTRSRRACYSPSHILSFFFNAHEDGDLDLVLLTAIPLIPALLPVVLSVLDLDLDLVLLLDGVLLSHLDEDLLL